MRSEVTWPTIPAMVRDAAGRFGDAEAVVDGERRVWCTELSAMASDGARALMASGIERGDRVAVWAPNSLEWLVAALSITTAGGVLVPVNTRFRDTEAAYVLARSGARSLFTVRGFLDTDYPALLAESGTDLPALEHTIPLAVFDVATILGMVERESITVLPGAPTIYQSLLDFPDLHRFDISSLRLAVTGAADIPVDLIRRVREELPFERILTGYGLTEAGTVTVTGSRFRRNRAHHVAPSRPPQRVHQPDATRAVRRAGSGGCRSGGPSRCRHRFGPRLVGIPTALEWLMSGQTVSAAEAADEAPHRSRWRSPALVWRMMTVDSPAAAPRIDSALLLTAAAASDAREGVAAFKHRRAPSSRGASPLIFPPIPRGGARGMEPVMAQSTSMEDHLLGRRGRLWARTTQDFPPPTATSKRSWPTARSGSTARCP